MRWLARLVSAEVRRLTEERRRATAAALRWRAAAVIAEARADALMDTARAEALAEIENNTKESTTWQ